MHNLAAIGWFLPIDNFLRNCRIKDGTVPETSMADAIPLKLFAGSDFNTPSHNLTTNFFRSNASKQGTKEA